jgi:hypothetical protein
MVVGSGQAAETRRTRERGFSSLCARIFRWKTSRKGGITWWDREHCSAASPAPTATLLPKSISSSSVPKRIMFGRQGSGQRIPPCSRPWLIRRGRSGAASADNLPGREFQPRTPCERSRPERPQHHVEPSRGVLGASVACGTTVFVLGKWAGAGDGTPAQLDQLQRTEKLQSGMGAKFTSQFLSYTSMRVSMALILLDQGPILPPGGHAARGDVGRGVWVCGRAPRFIVPTPRRLRGTDFGARAAKSDRALRRWQ